MEAKRQLWSALLLGGFPFWLGCQSTSDSDAVAKRAARAGADAPEPSGKAVAESKEPEMKHPTRGYAGVDACQPCHDAAVSFWNNTPHAKAFWTLVNVRSDTDPDCVDCHVTGAVDSADPEGQPEQGVQTARAGLTDIAQRTRLRAVQCETCHGPGSRHAETRDAADIRWEPDPELCRSCHQPPWSPVSWDAELAWTGILGEGHADYARR